MQDHKISRTLAVLVPICILLGVAIGASIPARSAPATPKLLMADTVRARSFELVDATGKLRAGIATIGGNTLVYVRDSQGKQRATLGLATNGDAYLDLEDGKNVRAQVSVWADGSPHLTLLNKNKNPILTRDDKGVALLNDRGEPRVWLGMADNGFIAKLSSTLHFEELEHPGGFLFLSDDLGGHTGLVPTRRK